MVAVAVRAMMRTAMVLRQYTHTMPMVKIMARRRTVNSRL